MTNQERIIDTLKQALDRVTRGELRGIDWLASEYECRGDEDFASYDDAMEHITLGDEVSEGSSIYLRVRVFKRD